MALALGIEPVGFSLLVGVVDVTGKGGWRRRGGRDRDGRLGLRRGRLRRQPRADDKRFACPRFERFLPTERDESGGEDDFEEEAHGGAGGG
jgi:hypothetical protein